MALGNKTSVTLLSLAPNGCQADRQDPYRLSLVPVILLNMLWLGMSSHSLAALQPRAPLGLVWESPIAAGSFYDAEVAQLLEAYEQEVGEALKPGERGQVALKINTRAGAGLSTPLELIRALVEALEARGYARQDVLIVDHSAHTLRQAGVMPPLSAAGAEFEGSPVLALDTERYYDMEWFYDSPMPPAWQPLQQESQLFTESRRSAELEAGVPGRKSFLPAPLLFEVDFWINLAVGVDDPSLGVDGVLANATLWNVSNSRRFLTNQATASAAVAEIAAIPELAERLVLNFVSLERYQFIAGPFFNSLYTRSEPRLWMSSDPVALDRLLYDRMNAMRLLEGFSEIQPMPRQLPFAASLGLGEFEREHIRIRELPHPESVIRERPEPQARPAAPLRQSPRGSWLRRIMPW